MTNLCNSLLLNLLLKGNYLFDLLLDLLLLLLELLLLLRVILFEVHEDPSHVVHGCDLWNFEEEYLENSDVNSCLYLANQTHFCGG